MRTIIMLIAALGILMGAYVSTFGVPTFASALVGVETEEAGTVDARPSRERGGGRSNSATIVVTTPLEMMPYESALSAVGIAEAQRSVNVLSNAAGEVIEVQLPSNSQI